MVMTGLMTDVKGSCVVTREELESVPVPPRTRSFTPIPHGDFIDIIGREASQVGLELGESTYAWGQEGQQLFGVSEVLGQDHLNNQVRLMMGYRSSYNKSLAAAICFGSKVFVCSNLCFSGYAGEDGVSGQVSHRHSRYVHRGFGERLQSAMGQFELFRNMQETFFRRLGDFPLDDDAAYATIVRAAQTGAISSDKVVRVADQWLYQENEPESEAENWHPEFQERNAWSLFNCFTEVHKARQAKNLVSASENSLKLTGLFRSRFN
jgi:hypothetical protein